MAAEIGLRVADKKDSQEICFVSAGQHADFIRRRRDGLNQSLDTSGKIGMLDGRVVGTHEGIEGFTIGQRKGLGVALGEPALCRENRCKKQHGQLGPQRGSGTNGFNRLANQLAHRRTNIGDRSERTDSLQQVRIVLR